MVGEPPRRKAPLSWFNARTTALRPGEWVVYDKHGRRFTTANDESYARRLAKRLAGRCEITDDDSRAGGI